MHGRVEGTLRGDELGKVLSREFESRRSEEGDAGKTDHGDSDGLPYLLPLPSCLMPDNHEVFPDAVDDENRRLETRVR